MQQLHNHLLGRNAAHQPERLNQSGIESANTHILNFETSIQIAARVIFDQHDINVEVMAQQAEAQAMAVLTGQGVNTQPAAYPVEYSNVQPQASTAAFGAPENYQTNNAYVDAITQGAMANVDVEHENLLATEAIVQREMAGFDDELTTLLATQAVNQEITR